MAWAPDYLTLAELKEFLHISDTADDTQLSAAIAATSRAIDRSAGRQFGVVSTVEERFYTARYDRARCRWVVEIDDLMSTSNMAFEVQDADGNTVAAIDSFVLEPRNAAQKSRPWTHLVVKPDSAGQPTGATDEVSSTALWGWTAFPTAVKHAAYLQSSRFHARRESPYGIAGSPDEGSEMRLLAKLDPDVAVSLGPYRRWWAAA